MKQEQLNKMIKCHQHYLDEDIDEWEETQADLSDYDLSGLDLSHKDLRYANLNDAKFYHADLRGVDLSYANLYGADLRFANLRDTKIDYPIACPENKPENPAQHNTVLHTGGHHIEQYTTVPQTGPQYMAIQFQEKPFPESSRSEIHRSEGDKK